jgi:putative ABC transport system ATP-binding protein
MPGTAVPDGPALRFENVGKRVVGEDGPRQVLRGINGRVESGRIVTLIGPSGAGKSTLLAICNLLQTPDEGKLWVWGREVRDWRPTDLRRRVGLVLQQPVMLPGTVADNLAMAPRLRGEAAPEAAEQLRQVGLPPDLAARPAADLSGGQKQRIALARTLANQPDILLVDEVTSALDRESAQVIEQLIVHLAKSRSLTVLWVTHDLAQAARVGDETWLLAAGEVVEQTPTREFFTEPRTEFGRRYLRGQSGQSADGEQNAFGGRVDEEAPTPG